MANDYGNYINNNSNYDARDLPPTSPGDGSSALPPPAIMPRSHAIDGSRSSAKQAMDVFAWVDHFAPKWNPGRTYKAGEQVSFGGNVYRVPNGSGDHSGVTPGAADSKWLYHGTVENNYKYYANSESDKNSVPNRFPLVDPVAGAPKQDEADALHRLKSSFHSSFFRVQLYLHVWNASGAKLYGGSNSSNRNSLDYKFSSYEKTLRPGGQWLPKGGIGQFFYLRPEDKGGTKPIDPTAYRYVPFVTREGVRGGTRPVVAVAVMPEEWRADAIAIAKPDYGYLFVPEFGARKSLGSHNLDPNLEFYIHGSGDKDYLIQYKG